MNLKIKVFHVDFDLEGEISLKKKSSEIQKQLSAGFFKFVFGFLLLLFLVF